MTIILSHLADRGAMYLIREPETPAFLGSDPAANVRVDDRRVSGLHCMIDRIGEKWVIRDLATSHGTYVNGRRVDQAVLQPGDELTLGETALRVHYDRGGRQRGRRRDPPHGPAHSA
jgi:pSer/pThr/pTyr-binding forkhead associated (FHA) protein